jgi:hypothetical protein
MNRLFEIITGSGLLVIGWELLTTGGIKAKFGDYFSDFASLSKPIAIIFFTLGGLFIIHALKRNK